jgi:hypothetical protein
MVVGSSLADTIKLKADLSASNVPPNAPTGKGTLDATYNTNSKELIYTVTYSGLTGPATAAHFHGPAAAGANAGLAIQLRARSQAQSKGQRR